MILSPVRLGLIALGVLAGSGAAHAACASPGGEAGEISYAANLNVMVFCNGTDWVSMAGWDGSGGGGATSLAGLSDVDTSGASTGKVLAYDGSQWVPSTTAPLSLLLGDLTNVNTSGAATGSILSYNGSSWVVSSTATSTALGDRITSGTLAMIANSPTAFISLSTAGTTWGYFNSANSYLPQLVSGRVSSTDISSSIVDMSANTVSNIAGGGGNFIASGTTSVSASSTGNLRFATNDTERMIVHANGNVGIGTSSPQAKLVVVRNTGGSSGAALLLQAEGTAQSQEAGLSFYPTFESTGDNGPRRAADIFAGYSGGAWGNEYLAFLVGGSDDTARLGSERMRIRANGTVGIGTSSPDQGKVEVKGGTVCVDTNSDDSATSCIASESDARLKQNVKPLENSLEKILQLQGVSFDWKVSDSEVLKHYPLISRFKNNPHSIGLIAQDVQKVVPEAIEGETIGDDEVQYLQLDYTKLVPHLINGMKELKAANDNLRAIVREQGNQIDELKAMVKASAKP